jgi:hybrid cluster-associated redox disulfide protein
MDRRSELLHTTILELLTEWPTTAPVFIRYKMACIGCSMSVFETVSDAAKNYQMPVDQFLIELTREANIHQA